MENKTRKSDVCAVIVTYNRCRMLEKCLNSLKNQSYGCDVLVIDNHSTDGTPGFLEEYCSQNLNCSFYINEENTGGSGGFNQGLKRAYQSGYDYFWLMDDDCIVKEDALEKLLQADRDLNGNYGFLSPLAKWKDGSLCKMNIQSVDLLKNYKNTNSEYEKIITATFVGFFINRKTVQKVGLPIKDFFIWSDDIEYSRRITKTGFNGYVIPESIVVHEMSDNKKVGIETESAERIWRYEFLYRNELYVYRREGIKGMLLYSARVFLHIFRVIASDSDCKILKVKTILRSVRKGLKFNPEIEHV